MTKRNYLFLCCAFLWMGIIFWFSSRNADQSNAQSDGFIVLFLSRYLADGIPEFLSTVVRKCAHFAVYLILGANFYLAFERKDSGKRIPFCAALACSALYATLDEVHQMFVPGRAGRLFDVCVDSAGALCGCLLTIGMLMLLRRKMKTP